LKDVVFYEKWDKVDDPNWYQIHEMIVSNLDYA